MSYPLSRCLTVILLVPVLLTTTSFAAPYDPHLGTAIDAYLTGKSSPIAGNGGVFFTSGVQYNVDPRLIVAIAGTESSFGTAWAACPASGFNAWSWFYNGNCANSPFSSFAEGIQTVTKFMRRSYLSKGLTTIPLIGARYCASGCSSWVSNTTRFYTDLNGDTSDLTFSSVLINFEQFSGSSFFTGVQPPLTVGAATISGGQILSQTTFLPGDQTTLYGAAFFCPGCSSTITITFSRPVSSFSVFVYNGQTFNVTYTVSDDKGGTQTKTLDSNKLSGFATFNLPSTGITQVSVTSSAGSSWDFFIDNIRFADSQ